MRETVLKSFLRDTSGALAVWGALAMPAVIGSAAFSVDAARIYNLDHDLQSAADAYARAAAVELDRRDDALTRAEDAVRRMVSNSAQMGDTPGTVTVPANGIRFLKSLPSEDHITPGDSHLATGAHDAKYVEVRVEPRDIKTVFPTSAVAKTLRLKMEASAVAGKSQRICGVAPIFICNPYENTNRTIYEAMDAGDLQKRQIRFQRPQGSARACSSQYNAGSFGYLDVAEYPDTSDMIEAVGIDLPRTCFEDGQPVRMRADTLDGMHHGFNTRFDIYGGVMAHARYDDAYAPAENVVKGYSGRVCHTRPNWSAMGLPKDNCQLNGGRCYGWGGNIGDGKWDFVGYMARNHNYMRQITIEGTTYTLNYKRGTTSPSQPPTRYDMYRWEIDNNCVPGPKTYKSHSRTSEEGLPQCHVNGPSTSDVDRRVITVAVLNCRQLDHSIGMLPDQDLPVETFVKMFMTQPMGAGRDDALYGEIIGPVRDETDARSDMRAELSR